MRLFNFGKCRLPDSGIPLSAEQLTVLHSAEAYREQLLQLIAKAKHRILLCALYLEHDSGGEKIMQALLDARQARPDLDIRVFVDAHRARRGLIGSKATGNTNADWYQKLAREHAANVPAIFGIPVQSRELFGVLHLKGHVIDDQVFYSGASFNNVYLQMQQRYRHDRYHILDCKPLADCFADYLEQLSAHPAAMRLDLSSVPAPKEQIRQLRKQLQQHHYQYPIQTSTNAPSLNIYNSLGHHGLLNQQILALLSSAQQKITLCTPYFNLPRKLAAILNDKLMQGCQVEIIVGDKTANDFYIPPEQPFRSIAALPYLYETNLRSFAKKQQQYISTQQLAIRLWRDGDNSFHLKGIWVDKCWQLLTGNNLNPRAFRLDLENGILIKDPKGELFAASESELQQIRQHTTQLTHYRELQSLPDYPVKVQKLLTRLHRVRLDKLLKRML